MSSPAVIFAFFAFVSAASAGTSKGHFDPQRIVGGSLATINQYPYSVALLYSATQTTYTQTCGGTILNQRSVLTAAHCFYQTGMIAGRWRSRVGSTWANSGGSVYLSSQIINHPQYYSYTEDNDFSILRLSSNIQYIANTVAPATIASATYKLADNQTVWAIGWGRVSENGLPSEQLRHVQVWTINRATCRQRYATRNLLITDNMLCSGWLNVGGRDQCQGDSGGPLIHNNIVVGVSSWGLGCGDSYFPGVNAYVPVASNWVLSNA